jgi:DNA (cytosine-5)-methyltransferase 1
MIVDLFAGPGGWDLAAQQLGLHPIGIELDRDTCATRAAAGLATIRAELGRNGYRLPAGATLTGLIASPPCQSFSAAGTRDGAKQLPEFIAALESDDWLWLRDGWHSDLYLLAESARWALDHKPRWIAMEQVPPVLLFWQALGRKLEQFGYRWWAGVLNAADYGVPQCRRRAILMAHTARSTHPPAATHAEYPQPDLFGWCPEPWRTMADGIDINPNLTVNLQQTSRQAAGSVPYLRSADRPSATITCSSAQSKWILTRPATMITGDSRCWPPGHKYNQDDIDRMGESEAKVRCGDRAGTDAVYLTIEQAAALQSFPPSYPWQGTKRSQSRQIGNAVPPLLAQAILQELIG